MVYAYIRVSSDKQEVESQKIGVIRKAEELKVKIDEWISDDGVSGVKEYAERQLGLLMEKIKDGDIIIVSEVSRLARSVFMLFRIVEHCTQKVDAVIHTCKENQVLKKNDLVSAIILSAYGTAAQIEREMIVKRTLEGLERRKKDGVIFGRPIGSRSTKIKEKHALLFPKIKELYEKGVSKNGILKMLNISRSVLQTVCNKYNFELVFRTNDENRLKMYRDNLSKAKQYQQGVYSDNLLRSEKSLIIDLISQGKTYVNIYTELKIKHPELKYNSLLRYIKNDQGLESFIIEKQKEHRAVRNADCGKNNR